MKTYTIRRYDASILDCRVREGEGPSRQLLHVVLHSPSGFNAGYLGSGPADLALSILVDYFGDDPDVARALCRGMHGGESRAVRLHQRFKQDIIANVLLKVGESYDLAEAQIGMWLNELGGTE